MRHENAARDPSTTGKRNNALETQSPLFPVVEQRRREPREEKGGEALARTLERSARRLSRQVSRSHSNATRMTNRVCRPRARDSYRSCRRRIRTSVPIRFRSSTASPGANSSERRERGRVFRLSPPTRPASSNSLHLSGKKSRDRSRATTPGVRTM